MGLGGTLRSLLRLAALGALVAVVVTAVGPGGPIDPGGLHGRPTEPGGTGATAEPALGGENRTVAAAPRGAGESPWDSEVLLVAVRNRAAPGRNVTAPTADALDYWNANSGYGAYPARFRLARDGEAPDLVVRYNVTIDCPAHDDAIGCAPVLGSLSRVDPPIDVQVRYDPSDNRRQVRNTVIHELGHVLGIGHCEPPHWAMASECAGALPPEPNATERDLAWRDATLAVYVDDGNVSAAEREATREQVKHALAYLERDDARTLPADVEFRRVDDRFEADVAIVFAAEPACGVTGAVCYEQRGRDVDGDGVMEYYTAGTVVVESSGDVDARGWYVGWGLAHQLSPGDVPPVFVDASYRERRGQWWE